MLTLTKLERTRRRLQKRIAADEAAKADGHVMAAVPEPVEIKADLRLFITLQEWRDFQIGNQYRSGCPRCG